MSYHIYTTEGLVLKSFDFGESNKLIYILTRDLGTIKVRAQSAREIRSKLRFSLQDFSHSEFSLVRGREVWRLVNARPMTNIYSELKAKNSGEIEVFANVLQVLRRLVRGEEKNTELFEIVFAGFDMMLAEKMPRDELKDLEYLTTLRILDVLGYVGAKGPLGEIAKDRKLDVESLKKSNIVRSDLVHIINDSLEHSHL